MISISEIEEEGAVKQQYRVLVTGRTGTGKSSLCNALLGRDEFTTGWSLFATTFASQSAQTIASNVRIKVVDTPDITSFDLSPEQKKQEVAKWRQLTAPRPSVIILTVRCHVGYTSEEYATYQTFKELWYNDSFCERLVVVFTFGDCFTGDIATEIETGSEELKSLLRDAGDRYIVYNKQKDDKRSLTNKLINAVHEMNPNPLTSPSVVFNPEKPKSLPSQCRHYVMLLLAALSTVTFVCSVFLWTYVGGDVWPYVTVGVSAASLVLLLCLIPLEMRQAGCT